MILTLFSDKRGMLVMYGIGKLFDTKYGGLMFSLLSGFAYFTVIHLLVLASTPNGKLLSFFFFPAITAGAALFMIKTVKRLAEEERYRNINIFLYAHVLLMLLSVVFFVDIMSRL